MSDDKLEQPGGMTILASRIFDTPLLIHEGKLQQILHVLGPRLNVDVAGQAPDLGLRTPEEASAAIEQAGMQAGTRATWNAEGGYFNVGAAAVVPVIGTMVHRSSWMDAFSGLTSYGKIERAFTNAMNDQLVEEVILELDTPGGEVAGAFDLADRIYSARGEKPITAIASEFAASAGYLIASAADDIVLPATGWVGSIGVVAAHIDRSKEMAKRGIAVTYIYAGDKKIDGNPYQPLSERARAEWQGDIDEIYGMFVATVAKHRGLSEQVIRNTEAGMFMGRKAVGEGLADRVNTFSNEVYNASLRRGGLSRLTATTEGTTMTDKDKSEQEKKIAEARAEGIAQGRKDAEGEAEGTQAEACKTAVGAERERIKAIVGADEAKGREEFASHLAFESDMTAEQAVAMLSKSPAGATKSQLAAAMETLGTPGIAQQEATDEPAKPAGVDTMGIYAAANKPYNEALKR